MPSGGTLLRSLLHSLFGGAAAASNMNADSVLRAPPSLTKLSYLLMVSTDGAPGLQVV